MDITPIPLPYGKNYQIFLSFCHEDEEVALSLLNELEEKYQLKCLCHVRDFTPGVTVMDNILNGIEKSMKIVYLVSESFKQNQWCSSEILYGITASHKQCENSMIPVLLEKTEMPRELQTINYVDATIDGTDIASKIHEACVFGASDTCILPNVISFQGLRNGSVLRVIRRIKVWDYGIPKITFSEDTDKRSNISDQLRSQKIDTLCCKILDEVNSSKFKRWYFLHDPIFFRLLWCFAVLGASSMSLIPLLLYLVIEGDITEGSLGGLCTVLIVVPIITVTIIIGCYAKYNKKGEKEIDDIVWQYLIQYFQTLNVLPVMNIAGEIGLRNYDTDPCKTVTS
ncbi:uncharacterized protein LOC125654095 isoform X2 [Ostrea edulis]|uniref:uncharacterized protein LOC125654095 isoform X2 n=1 Tax=Ostrea edulis TaxID=37623 RepID=UPI0024AFB6A7|nr:uncharacterized protein LOC125654095 isoform X2 [Ostrea edulis]